MLLAAVMAFGMAACGHEGTTQLAVIASRSGNPSATSEPAVPGQPGASNAAELAVPSYPPTIPPSSSCPASGVTVMAWSAEKAMGLRDVTLRAFNCGQMNRTFSGYPGVRLLDANGMQLPVAIRKGVIASGLRNPKPADIVIKPGDSAMTLLSWRTTTTQANPITAAQVRILPVRGAQPQVLPLTVDLGNTGRVAITAWERFAT